MTQRPLELLQAADFEPLVGQTFRWTADGSSGGEWILEEVRLLGHRRKESSRDPFAITFRGPAGLRLPQAVYRMDQAVLGALEIFLVQVADKPEGSFFEAVFT